MSDGHVVSFIVWLCCCWKTAADRRYCDAVREGHPPCHVLYDNIRRTQPIREIDPRNFPTSNQKEGFQYCWYRTKGISEASQPAGTQRLYVLVVVNDIRT